MSDRFEPIVEALYEHGWHVCRGFLTPEETHELAGESRAAWEAGEFRRAGVGTGSNLRFDAEIRRDHVHWLHESALTPAQRRYFEALEELRQAINRGLMLGLFGFEGHFAVYPAGAFYKTHLDQFKGARHRVVSAILYLNDGWTPEDGGQLRLYLEGATGPHVDVPPLGGTLVTFLSARFYHEVLPARRERLSLTGWFRTRE